MSKWTKIAKPDPKGHRFFILTEKPDGAIYACDDSGETPDDVEDQHLILNRDGCIRATTDGYFLVPMSKFEKPSSMIASFTEAVWLCATYHMRIEHRGRKYSLLEDNS